MRISVVIPSYNRASYLPFALDSVLAQTSAAEEIIVVDDGSSDDTSDLLTRYPQIRVLRQANRGVSAARNLGIKNAQHQWIALLDSDDSWLPQKLEKIRQAQQLHPEILLFHSDEIWIRNGVRVNPMRKHRKSGGDIFQHCLPLCVVSPSAAVIEKPLLETIGLFDESLPACEDYDLWLRICHNHPVHFIDQPLIIKHGGHADQLSRKHWGMDRFRIHALYRLLRNAPLTPTQEKLARSMLTRKLDILLKGAYKHHNQQVIDEFSPLAEHYATLNPAAQKEPVAC